MKTLIIFKQHTFRLKNSNLCHIFKNQNILPLCSSFGKNDKSLVYQIMKLEPRVHFEVKNMKQKLIQHNWFSLHSLFPNIYFPSREQVSAIWGTHWLPRLFTWLVFCYIFYHMCPMSFLARMHCKVSIYHILCIWNIFIAKNVLMHRILLNVSGNIWNPVLLCMLIQNTNPRVSYTANILS